MPNTHISVLRRGTRRSLPLLAFAALAVASSVVSVGHTAGPPGAQSTPLQPAAPLLDPGSAPAAGQAPDALPPLRTGAAPFDEEMPPQGRGNMLSEAQLRYCLAQYIRTDAVRSILNRYRREQVAHFNALIADYNTRCGKYRYELPALDAATRDVETNRTRIAEEARVAFAERFSASAQSAAPLPSREPTGPAAIAVATPEVTPPAQTSASSQASAVGGASAVKPVEASQPKAAPPPPSPPAPAQPVTTAVPPKSGTSAEIAPAPVSPAAPAASAVAESGTGPTPPPAHAAASTPDLPRAAATPPLAAAESVPAAVESASSAPTAIAAATPSAQPPAPQESKPSALPVTPPATPVSAPAPLPAAASKAASKPAQSEPKASETAPKPEEHPAQPAAGPATAKPAGAVAAEGVSAPSPAVALQGKTEQSPPPKPATSPTPVAAATSPGSSTVASKPAPAGPPASKAVPEASEARSVAPAPEAEPGASPPTEVAALAPSTAEAPPSKAEEAALARYIRKVERAGARTVLERDYPAEARGKKWEGTTKVEVRFATGGYIKSIVLAESCGHAPLDERALELARSIIFPYVPKALTAREFSVQVPITFRQRKS